ncbi:MAG: hypothetical protein O3A84_02230 [Proteobacteria bacterium]|nr:hypothetical protein [Pseudomonadota bacterium]
MNKFGILGLAVLGLAAVTVFLGAPAFADMTIAVPHAHPHAAETHGFVIAAYYGLAMLASTGVYFAVKAWARNK